MLHSQAASSDVASHSIELRSRSHRNVLSRFDDEPSSAANQRVNIDHVIQPGDTLNGIALQYSVQVSEIKRANGLVSDQEIYALPSIRIPVSSFQRELLMSERLSSNDYEQVSSHLQTSKISSGVNGLTTTPAAHIFSNNLATNNTSLLYHNDNFRYSGKNNSCDCSGKTPLLEDYDDGGVEDDFDDESTVGKQDGAKAIETLFEKTDATVAAVRENLCDRSPPLEGGTFHFIDATAPDNTSKGIWLIVFSVIFMFVVVPLVLTLMEESHEQAEQQYHQHHQHVGGGGVSDHEPYRHHSHSDVSLY